MAEPCKFTKVVNALKYVFMIVVKTFRDKCMTCTKALKDKCIIWVKTLKDKSITWAKILKDIFMVVVKTLGDIVDELLLMVTGAGVALLLFPDLSGILSGRCDSSFWKIAIIFAAIIILLFKFLIQLKVFKIKGVPAFNRSTLIIGILAFMLYATSISLKDDTSDCLWIILNLIFVEDINIQVDGNTRYFIPILTTITIIIYFIIRSSKCLITKIKTPIEGKRDEELPIEDVDHDDFCFEAYAKIAAGKIMSKETSGVGLLGEYGCGKSSFANLMRNHLLEKKEYIYLKIDGWGLAEGGTVHYILDQIERELYKHNDTLRINRVSNEYQNILLKQSEDRTFGLLSIFNRKKSAAELIKELNEVLISINKKIILLIEDLDRNSNDHRLFAEIGSFLDICKKQSNIYFIVPIAELENTKVITRCCKYYHRFLDISSMCTKSVRNLAEERLAHIKDITIPVSENNSNGNSIDTFFAFSNLATMINTPRKLRSISSIIKTQYEILEGEIDFYDFMIITFLRECKDDVENNQKSGYNFLIEVLPHMLININILKDSYSRNFFKSTPIDIKKELRDINEKMVQAYVPKNQQDLILYLINGAARHQNGQRLLCNEYTNYWLYYWTGKFNIKGEIFDKPKLDGQPKLSDQTILKEIDKINSNTSEIDIFINFVEKCDLIYHKFRQFYHRLELSNTFLAITKKFIMNTEKSNPSDLNEISKIFLERIACESIDVQIDDGRKLESWWHEVLRDTLLNAPNKVRPITDIILSNTQPDDIKSKQIYTMIAEELKDICDDPEDNLIKILSGKPYSTLKDITFNHNSQVSITQTPRDDTWYFLGEWLLKNVDKNKKLLIGNIIHLTASFGEGVFIPYQFLPYFWNKPTELLKLFVDEKYDITFDDDEKLQKVYVQLKTDAKTLLDQFSNSEYGKAKITLDEFANSEYGKNFNLWLKEEKYKGANYWGLFYNNDGRKIGSSGFSEF